MLQRRGSDAFRAANRRASGGRRGSVAGEAEQHDEGAPGRGQQLARRVVPEQRARVQRAHHELQPEAHADAHGEELALRRRVGRREGVVDGELHADAREEHGARLARAHVYTRDWGEVGEM